MSQLDDLLARTSKPGRFVEHKRFVLSRDKAIDKQREFALRHPSQYVTELVQAAVFAGATYIAIDARPSSVLVAWVGGKVLEESQVENLLDYLFADRGDPEVRHLVQLAVGINAALQRKPRLLRIESGDGQSSLRMDVDRRGRAEGGRVEDAIAGTYLYAEFSGGWLKRFAGSTYTEEQSQVEERCLYTPVPILLNGRAPFGYRASRHIEVFGADAQSFFDDGSRRGVVAVHSAQRAERGFRIVVGGVWVSSMELDDLSSLPLVGVVCDDHLRKTADHSDIVRDRRFTELLHGVQPHANELLRGLHPTYVPPALPALPAVEARSAGGAPQVEPEALPESIPMVAPRGMAAPHTLDHATAPLFYVSPEHFAKVVGDATEPHQFPWRVLVLTEGQALTLGQRLGGALHRLTARADLTFVQRMLQRTDQVRQLEVQGAPRLTLRLHLQGALPDWGHGRPGVPWCIEHDDETLAYGVLDDRVRTVARRDGEVIEPAVLSHPVHLPGVSVVVHSAEPVLSPATVARAIHGAWRLAVPERGEADVPLLAALLGSVGLPQLLRADGRLSVEASLPKDWPDALRHVPLADTEQGPLTLQAFLALQGTDEVWQLRRASDIPVVEALEARFGMGHLTHPSLEGRPLFGVGYIGRRWVWLDGAPMWKLSAIEQLCFVGSTLSPRTHDERWVEVERPAPELVAARRADVEPVDMEEGWRLLRSRLMELARDRSWQREAHGEPTRARAEGMGRRALLNLTAHLGELDVPLFAPSDQGALRSLATLRTHPAARVAARHGVEVAEPWTFLLTRDELGVVEGPDGPALRYDDGPAVWQSLAEGDDGWLLRHEVRQPGLNGWLGLRLPHDATSGVLVRTTDRLLALPEIDERVPCHGLLWPDHGSRPLGPEQRRTVRLGALRLYQELVPVLQRRDTPERREAARRYAFVYVWRAHVRGQMGGTARELAKLVDVFDAQGHVWGPLEQWLETDPERRPPVDASLTPHPPEGADEAPLAPPPSQGALEGRLLDALALPELTLYLPPEGGDSLGPPCRLDEPRCTLTRVVLPLNHDHPMTKAAVGRPGPARELLLLELSRRIVTWGEERGLPLSMGRVHQALVAQRLDA